MLKAIKKILDIFLWGWVGWEWFKKYALRLHPKLGGVYAIVADTNKMGKKFASLHSQTSPIFGVCDYASLRLTYLSVQINLPVQASLQTPCPVGCKHF